MGSTGRFGAHTAATALPGVLTLDRTLHGWRLIARSNIAPPRRSYIFSFIRWLASGSCRAMSGSTSSRLRLQGHHVMDTLH